MIDINKPRLTVKNRAYCYGCMCDNDRQPECCFCNEQINEYNRLQELENAIESGELVPVVHGRWENRINEYFRTCSNCEISMGMLDGESLERFCYCPFCGAKMDLEGQK